MQALWQRLISKVPDTIFYYTILFIPIKFHSFRPPVAGVAVDGLDCTPEIGNSE